MPHDWTGEVRIVGVTQQGEQFVAVEVPAKLPQAYELHVGTREGDSGEASLAHLTRLPTAAGAQALADRLAVIDANADPRGKAAKLARLHALSALQADLGAARAMLRAWPDSSIARAAANEATRAYALLTCDQPADALHYLGHLARLEATQQPPMSPFLEAARSLEAILSGVQAAPAAVAAPPAPERAAPSARIYLDVPFDEKDQAKALGAKWDKGRKQWYAPQEADVQRAGLARWLPTQQVSPQEAFASAIRALGLELDGPPIMDGRIQRVPVTGDKGKQRAGAYAGHLDGRIPGGYIQNFKTGERVNWKYEGRLPSLTASERAQCEAEAAERTARRAAETAAQHEATARLAQLVWDEALPATPDHPYCADKGITEPGENGLRIVPDHVSAQATAAGIRIAATPKEAKALRAAEPEATVLLAGDLLVPARDGDGKLWSLQSINPRFKGLMKHGRMTGLYTVAGAEPAAFAAMLESNATLPLVLAEGYATADTVARLIGQPVIVAFDSGNLMEVAANLRARWPDRLMLVATDNDHLAEKTTLPNGQPGKNVGLRKAQEVAETYGAGLMVPVFREDEKGSDWNDYARLHGMEAARSAIAEQMALARIDAALMSERLMTLARTRELEAVDDPSTSADDAHVAHERAIAQEVMGQAISGATEVRAEAIDALVANAGGVRPAAVVQASVDHTNAVLNDEVREQREQVLGASQAQQRRARGHDLGL